jgi:RND family efflux transporter MFP subunit
MALPADNRDRVPPTPSGDSAAPAPASGLASAPAPARRRRPVFALLLAGAAVLALVWLIGRQLLEEAPGTASAAATEARRAPVEVAAIDRGPIELRRSFSGTLLAEAHVRVAPRVGGRIERMLVDLADPVESGQVIAVLDSAEFQQDVLQAQAELAVARANLTAATNALEIADREIQRQTTLREQGVASDTRWDQVRAQQLAASAEVAVARAQVQRAEAALENATIRLGYTQVRAVWDEGPGRRFVSARMAEEGDTVAANTPLISVVQLDPIKAVLYVSERDYARMQPGLKVVLTTDAHPSTQFPAEVTRISPVFESSSRQARVELTVPNSDLLLKPGMFVRAMAVLDRVEQATIVPEMAVVRRGDQPVVFVVDEQQMVARMRPVELGIADAGRVQVLGEGLEGRVVTLGQQLLDDGTPVVLAGEEDTAAAAAAPGGVDR